MTILGLFVSSSKHTKWSAETLGLIVCTLILTVGETQQLWQGVEKGKCFLHAVQRFTISPWLPRHSYITSEHVRKKKAGDRKKKEGKDRREREIRGGGKETRWCHAFHSKRRRSSQQGKHHTFFLLSLILRVTARCRNAERQLQCRPRISADVANWPYLASRGRKKEGRRRRGPKFHIGFLSNQDWCGVSSSL